MTGRDGEVACLTKMAGGGEPAGLFHGPAEVARRRNRHGAISKRTSSKLKRFRRVVGSPAAGYVAPPYHYRGGMRRERGLVQTRLAVLQFRLGRWGWPVHAGVVVCTAAFLLHDGAPAPEIGWLTALAVLSVILAVYCRLATPRWHRGYLMLTGLVGLAWGGGTALGAVAIQHPRLSATVTSLCSALPLLALAHLRTMETQGVAMAVMIALFGATLLLLARQMNASLRANVALLAERERLPSAGAVFRDDLAFVLGGAKQDPPGNGSVILGDARDLPASLDERFDVVVTSPPYANRMSYIRELRP